MNTSSPLLDRFSSLSTVGDLANEVWPLLLTVAVILGLGVCVGALLGWLAKRLLMAVRKTMPEGAAQTAFTDVVARKGAGDMLARGVFWLVMFIALTLAAEAIGLSIVAIWTQSIAEYAPRVVLALAIVLAGLIAGRIAGDLTARLARRVSPKQAARIASVVSWTVYVLAALVAASQVGFDVSFITTIMLVVLAATLGGMALAFGLGARGIVTDILAIHYADQAYRPGQRVRIGEIEGRVVRTTATSVLLDTAAGETTVPGRLFSATPCVALDDNTEGES